jgi:CNT family concentrative nucleoside transporter
MSGTSGLRAISAAGLGVMLLLAWLMSSQRRQFPWRVVGWGLALQLGLAALILRTNPGQAAFVLIGQVFEALLGFVDHGSQFVFGTKYEDFYFAFKVLPTIIFVSALMSILYHLGLIQPVVQGMAWLMQWTLGTSGAETLAASANIFMGQTEAPLVVRPYIPQMTVSELNAVMVAGFATISGGLIAVYSQWVPAAHLLTASVISAPAALLIAKVMEPETQRPATLGRVTIDLPRRGVNVIEAAAIGAAEGARLAINVAAMLLAFLALLAMLDAGLKTLGQAAAWLGEQSVWQKDVLAGRDWSLSAALGYLFAPLAWLMGIEPRDCLRAGELLGLKMFATEFNAYAQLGQWEQPGSGVELSPRTVSIVAYALCGFSNFASIGIQIGGLGGLAPERQSDLARLGLRAMLGGTLACLMTGCVAGLLV